MGTTEIWHFTPETWHFTPKADLSVLQIGGMPTLEIFAAVFGVSAMALGWAFDLQGGHFGSLGWAFSGASYYWIYAANIWRKYVILRVSVWGMNLFYWIYAANI